MVTYGLINLVCKLTVCAFSAYDISLYRDESYCRPDELDFRAEREKDISSLTIWKEFTRLDNPYRSLAIQCSPRFLLPDVYPRGVTGRQQTPDKRLRDTLLTFTSTVVILNQPC